jgi:hypothetical protein
LKISYAKSLLDQHGLAMTDLSQSNKVLPFEGAVKNALKSTAMIVAFD